MAPLYHYEDVDLNSDSTSGGILVNGSQIARKPSLGQQDPKVLPPIPIIPLSRDYIMDAEEENNPQLERKSAEPGQTRWIPNARQKLKRDADRCSKDTECADGRYAFIYCALSILGKH